MREMSDFDGLQRTRLKRHRARAFAINARSATDDTAGTACQRQARQALQVLVGAAPLAIYADPRTSGLDLERPALRPLLDDVHQGNLDHLIVRDTARFARDVALLETILNEVRTAGVAPVVMTVGKRDA